MAQKRMFSKTVTNSSRFLMMPHSSQNLYFHLGMNADDDGFCEHFSIMRMTDAKPDDLKILQAKGFVHVFDDHVLIVIDWKENNYLRNDRYKPSKYLSIYREDMAKIGHEMDNLTLGIPDVRQMDTQVRLDKVRLEKNTSIPFEDFWKLYPKKVEKKKSELKWGRLVADLQRKIIADLPLRKKGKKWSKDGGMYIENPLTYLNGERWNDEIEALDLFNKSSGIVIHT